MIWFLILAIPAAYLLAIRGRRGAAGLEQLRSWRYAHRGLHAEGRPENSMAAFRAALEHGYGIELDLHLLRDGSVAVLHDSSLKRVTGRDGTLEDLTAEDLSRYHLRGTEETIPLFSQVLELFDGKAPLIIELKTHNGNYAQLTKTVCRMLEDYPGLYCIESFDPYVVRWLKQNKPEIIRGQLAENSLHTTSRYSWLLRLITTYHLENFLTCPDFIAYRYEDRKNLSNFLCRKVWGIAGVSWTLRTREQFDTAEREGWIPIFEGFFPEGKA